MNNETESKVSHLPVCINL